MNTKTIPLTQGQFALVDADDYEKLSKYNWCALKHGNVRKYYYASRSDSSGEKAKNIRMHREIMGAPKGLDVDHINHDTLDNRKENLRVCTRRENLRNGLGWAKSSSKYKGVAWQEIRWNPSKNYVQKWIAYIQIGDKVTRLGYFEDEKKAALAYNKEAKKHFGEFTRLNNINS